MIFRTTVILAIATMVACGGKKKSNGPSKPGGALKTDTKTVDTGATKASDISEDTRNDFDKAVSYYKSQKTWNRSSCEKSASNFSRVAGGNKGLVEGYYMAGLSYQKCGMNAEASGEYNKALKKSPRHSRSKSNLAKIAYDKGDYKTAESRWKEAIAIDPKLSGARNSLAMLMIKRMGKARPMYKGEWATLEKDARGHLTQSLAVDGNNVETYVIYAHLWMEGAKKKKSRLDLAKLLLDEGKKRSTTYAPLHNAEGLLLLHRGFQGQAMRSFARAVELDPNFSEAQANLGQINLAFRNYGSAEAQFSKVLRRNPKDYDALIGLGYAQRGLRKFPDAESTYNKASQIDGSRGAAYFNLGVLYKDFKAAKEGDLRKSQELYRQAQKYFRQYVSKKDVTTAGKKEAEANISDCTKSIKQLETYIKAGVTAEVNESKMTPVAKTPEATIIPANQPVEVAKPIAEPAKIIIDKVDGN